MDMIPLEAATAVLLSLQGRVVGNQVDMGTLGVVLLGLLESGIAVLLPLQGRVVVNQMDMGTLGVVLLGLLG